MSTFIFRTGHGIGDSFIVEAPHKLDAFSQANVRVRRAGITGNFAWFDSANSDTTFTLGLDVLMD